MRLQNATEKQSELRDLLEENLKYTKEIWKISKKTKRYLIWVQVMDWIKISLIVIPTILLIIYLPTLMEMMRSGVNSIINPGGVDTGSLEQLKDIEGLMNLLKGSDAPK
jgi:hypothetical protein